MIVVKLAQDTQKNECDGTKNIMNVYRSKNVYSCLSTGINEAAGVAGFFFNDSNNP
jgi:hypothetical protein